MTSPRALFITHDTSNYGASRSLQLLLGGYRGAEVDLLVQRPLSGKLDHADLRKRFGGGIGKIYEAYLPFDLCYHGGRKALGWRLAIKAYNFLERYYARRQVMALIAAGGYQFIHLNSLVLNPLIDERYPFILHMRDKYDGSNPAALVQVGKAAGIVFIDDATREPFLNVSIHKSIVLNNPFDMSGVAAYKDFRPERHDIDPTRHTVFSVIGVASEQKGTGFITQTFLRLQNPDARLLVVGGREEAALSDCKKLAAHDPRVIFWGEETEIEKIYAISDYILRGEAFPCVGRTVYEGLYAGCRVIVPGDPEAPPPMFEMETFRDSIFFYRPRHDNELLTLFFKLAGDKVGERQLRSNRDAYIAKFEEFLETVLQGSW